MNNNLIKGEDNILDIITVNVINIYKSYKYLI
jgi:hypothetical protein